MSKTPRFYQRREGDLCDMCMGGPAGEYRCPACAIINLEGELAAACAYAVSGPSDALIAAAEKHAAIYEDDDRLDIVTDVLNAFYRGAHWARNNQY